MALMKWRSPSEELTRMERRMRQLFGEPFRMELFTEDMGWVPAMEVAETDAAIEITAELPGMTPDAVDIHLENNVLTIRGEKKATREETEKERYLFERFYGSFQRALALPTPVDEGQVSAEFTDGVLKIHLPKAPHAKGRKITING